LELKTDPKITTPMNDPPVVNETSSIAPALNFTTQTPITTTVMEVTTNNKYLYATVSEFVAKSTPYAGLADLKPTKTISTSEEVKPINFPDEKPTVASAKPTEGTTEKVTTMSTMATTMASNKVTLISTAAATVGTSAAPFVIKSSTGK
jgi:hypothetical protein